MKQLSVIIPTLNEAEHIDIVLTHAFAAKSVQPPDVLVVDGGSDDGTQALASKRVRVIDCKPGRARQMNVGWRHSHGDWLLFCHGDTLLPPTYYEAISRAFLEPDVVAGTFTPRYQPSHPLLRLAEWLLRLPTTKVYFGDSTIFVLRNQLEAVGGFPEVPLMEDVGLFGELAKRGRLVRLPERVITSSRRFMERGVLRQLVLDLRLLIAYHILRRSPQDIASLYWQTKRDLLQKEEV